MKKSILLSMLLFTFSIAANAQRFALIDMEYILKNIPAYERANEQLNQISKRWQSEVETISNESCIKIINLKLSFFLKNKKQKKRMRS